MDDKYKENVLQALDLCQGLGTMAEKRGASPQAMAMAASNSMASCLATSAMLHIIVKGMTRSEAIANMKEHGTDLLVQTLHQAVFKVANMDLPDMIRGYNENNPDQPFDELRPGWDN